jgi:tetratricopeptide (TPR) repeat protein
MQTCGRRSDHQGCDRAARGERPARTRWAGPTAAWMVLAALSGSARGQAPAPLPAPAQPSAASPPASSWPAPSPAPGSNVAPTANADAERLIGEGIGLRERGLDAEALQRFERAYVLAPTARAMAQRGLAEQALGRWLDAEAHLESSLADKADAWIRQHRITLEGSLLNVRRRIGTLQVQGGQPGAEVRLEGRLVGRLPLAAPLRAVAGRVTLEVTLEGHYPIRREVDIEGGAIATETIELAPLPQQLMAAAVAPPAVAEPTPLPEQALAPARPAAAAARSRGLPPWVFIGGAGASVALGGLSVWSGLNTRAHDDAYVDYAASPRAVPADAKRAYDRAYSAQTRTNVLLASTLVVAAASGLIGLVFTDWQSESTAGAAPGSQLRSAPDWTLRF